MKLNGTQSQEIKAAFASQSEPSLKSNGNQSSQTTTVNADAGSVSKLGELLNQASQVRQNFLAKFPPIKQIFGFGAEATVTKIGDKVVIDAGAGDDKIGITQDAKTGDVTVEVNGKKQTFTGKDKDNLVIKAGDGNDTVTVGKGVTVKLTIDGGDGNDNLQGGDGDDTITGGKGNDTIEAGAGDDTVDGGDGRDYINGSKGKDKLAGGNGNDVIYGGDDADTIDGGDGDDYLEGSKGNDTLTGGAGNDVLSGGIGDDTLKGGDGNDVIYAGEGKDDIYGEKGSNKIFSQTGDADDSKAKGVKNTVIVIDLTIKPGTSVVVKGSDEFKERVEADIEMLRSSETGRKMLTALDGSKKTVTIEKFNGANGGADSVNKVYGEIDRKTGKAGKADDASIGYNPQFMPGDAVEPMTVLFHEMSHAYNYMTGTLQPGYYKGDGTKNPPANGNDNPFKDAKGNIIEDPRINVRNGERQAVGLENDGVKYDFDNDPTTPATTANPKSLTENGLREEMNRPKRPVYRSN